MSATTANRKLPIATSGRPKRLMTARQRQVLFGLWKELSPSLTFEGTEREARMWYAGSRLQVPGVRSWSELTREQAAKLIHAMRFDLGRAEAPSPYARPEALEIIARLALELWGTAWHEALADRVHGRPYFHYDRLDKITKAESHSLIEELLDYVERKLNPEECAMALRKQRKEELRKRFRGEK